MSNPGKNQKISPPPSPGLAAKRGRGRPPKFLCLECHQGLKSVQYCHSCQLFKGENFTSARARFESRPPCYVQAARERSVPSSPQPGPSWLADLPTTSAGFQTEHLPALDSPSSSAGDEGLPEEPVSSLPQGPCQQCMKNKKPEEKKCFCKDPVPPPYTRIPVLVSKKPRKEKYECRCADGPTIRKKQDVPENFNPEDFIFKKDCACKRTRDPPNMHPCKGTKEFTRTVHMSHDGTNKVMNISYRRGKDRSLRSVAEAVKYCEENELNFDDYQFVYSLKCICSNPILPPPP